MKNRYQDLIEQTFEWPALSFNLDNEGLRFHNIPLMELVKKFGTPLKLTYLPKIGEQIESSRRLFNEKMQKLNYQASYTYSYCTKSSHFKFVLNEVLDHDAQIETSSAFDLDLLSNLYKAGKLPKNNFILCNGFKRELYINKIADFINSGFTNTVPILDNLEELDQLFDHVNEPFQCGIRIAAEEKPNFEFYTSRLGIRYQDVVPYYKARIQSNPDVQLKMLHFFINTGITDTAYYWSELNKCVNLYCDLKAICPELDSLDIGGGFPFPNTISFDYEYRYMVEQILANIKNVCEDRGVAPPHIFTEFGSYAVAESGANLFSILGTKQQNDSELWYMIDNSFITTLPDSWAQDQRFILLALNHWDQEYQRVNLGGLTCDSMDYYNSEVHENQVFLPKFPPSDPLVIGFFNTGAYQDSLSGYGGLKHCLVPSPQHILIDRDIDGSFTYQIFAEEQSAESMMEILGY